jgi:hypothetical protein
MLVKDAIAQAVAKLPVPTGRADKREASVRLSIRKMAKAGALPCERDGDYFVF